MGRIGYGTDYPVSQANHFGLCFIHKELMEVDATMINATIPLYIRFGEIPEDGQSKVHRSDWIIRSEGGVSVWRAVEDQGRYWPLLPQEPNGNTIADYFSMLTNRYHQDRKVYLVTGTEICVEGADREPLLMDCQIIKDISNQYTFNAKDEDTTRKNLLKELEEFGILTKEDLVKYKKMQNEKGQCVKQRRM